MNELLIMCLIFNITVMMDFRYVNWCWISGISKLFKAIKHSCNFINLHMHVHTCGLLFAYTWSCLFVVKDNDPRPGRSRLNILLYKCFSNPGLLKPEDSKDLIRITAVCLCSALSSSFWIQARFRKIKLSCHLSIPWWASGLNDSSWVRPGPEFSAVCSF